MFQKINNFFTSSFEELKKVIWPSRKELINHTVIVILAVLVSMLIVAALDLVFSTGINWLLNQTLV